MTGNLIAVIYNYSPEQIIEGLIMSAVFLKMVLPNVLAFLEKHGVISVNWRRLYKMRVFK